MFFNDILTKLKIMAQPEIIYIATPQETEALDKKADVYDKRGRTAVMASFLGSGLTVASETYHINEPVTVSLAVTSILIAVFGVRCLYKAIDLNIKAIQLDLVAVREGLGDVVRKLEGLTEDKIIEGTYIDITNDPKRLPE